MVDGAVRGIKVSGGTADFDVLLIGGGKGLDTAAEVPASSGVAEVDW
jgi:hypothetical protein